jgi:putative ABC transport system permease protein
VLAYTFGVAVITGVLFGLAPALRATRVSPSETLKTQGRTGSSETGGHPFSFGKLLLASQIALCLLLLIVAGLFARSLQALAQLELGFDRDHLLIVRIDPRAAGYLTADLNALYRRLQERVSAIPGVASVSMSTFGALSGGVHTSSMTVEGYKPRPAEDVHMQRESVTAGYFKTLGIRLVRGRTFEAQDSEGTRHVSVVNETFAKHYFNGRNPIGQHWSFGDTIDRNASEIIGVVADSHHVDLRSPIEPLMYALVVQGAPDDTEHTSVPYLTSLEVRTSGQPAALGETVGRVLREAEPRLPVVGITPMQRIAERMSTQEQLVAYLTTLFSGIALLLASLGLYGSISYAVTRRTGEIGIRMALGANQGMVLWLVMRDALILLLMGLAIGVPLALLAANGLRSMLFGIRFTDAATHLTAVAVLALVAAIAAYLPARRAARVDPMLALRGD